MLPAHLDTHSAPVDEIVGRYPATTLTATVSHPLSWPLVACEHRADDR